MTLADEEKRERKRAYMKEWRAANREHVRECRKAHRHAHESTPEHAERRREYVRRWRAANPERDAEQRKRQMDTPEQVARARERTREYVAAAQSLTRARATASGPWSPEEDAVLLEDRTDVEVALVTGRTFWAVVARRHRLRKSLESA